MHQWSWSVFCKFLLLLLSHMLLQFPHPTEREAGSSSSRSAAVRWRSCCWWSCWCSVSPSIPQGHHRSSKLIVGKTWQRFESMSRLVFSFIAEREVLNKNNCASGLSAATKQTHLTQITLITAALMCGWTTGQRKQPPHCSCCHKISKVPRVIQIVIHVLLICSELDNKTSMYLSNGKYFCNLFHCFHNFWYLHEGQKRY